MQALLVLLSAFALQVHPHMVLGNSFAHDMLSRWRSELRSTEEIRRYLRAAAAIREEGAYVVVSESLDVFVLTEEEEGEASLLRDVLWHERQAHANVLPKFERFRNLREWHNRTLNCSVVSDGQRMGDVGDFAVWLALYGKDA